MKVQLIQQNNNDNKIQKQPQFKGIVDTGLRYLATNQGVGANLTDFCFMVAPRVYTDRKRGPAACYETARREATGTCNHSAVGLYGAAAGIGVAGLMGLGKKYNIKAHQILTAPETLNILAENKAEQIKTNKSQVDYLKNILNNVKAYNPSSPNAKDGYVTLSDETIDRVSKLLDNEINKKDFKNWDNKGSKDSFYAIRNLIIADTGAESNYLLEFGAKEDQKITSKTTLEALLKDIYKISDAFNKENVEQAFKDQLAEGKGIKDNAFVKKLTKFSKIRSGLGFAIATGIGMSIQPINIYLTKKKTGSDGFVGVEGRSKDNSLKFKLMKGAAAAGFLGLTMASLKTGFKGFMKKMSFKGFWPTIPQLMGIYGLTIISRLLVTRDKDELRESLTKDTLGFLSWLVLGDIVNKLTARALDKKEHTVLNTNEKEVSGFWKNIKRTFNSSLKTRDEILVETLAQNGISVVKEDGVSKTFKEMLNDLNTKVQDSSIKEITRKRLSTLNKAQLAGYLFSGLVLGLGIPNLNIYITNTLDKKRKAKAAQQAA